MRISDWSSDVCSSDLLIDHIIGSAVRQRFTILRVAACRRSVGQGEADVGLAVLAPAFAAGRKFFDEIRNADLGHHLSVEEKPALLHLDDISGKADRSEEHTSELQSLMRISYAVFCLKNK